MTSVTGSPSLVASLRAAAAAALVFLAPLGAASAQPAQGWTEAERQQFYTLDQGSRIIPYAWFAALPRADGGGLFAADGLARFGYLPNPASPQRLPVGFMVADDIAEFGGRPTLGMNCAACHTREINVEGRRLRIDGGPALADFHGFLTELGQAVKAILATGGDFDGFARRVLGASYDPTSAVRLKADVAEWHGAYASFMRAALPDESWGPARLDAFGMIFNRVSGLDLGIPQNIAKADAPVRYPFLWNAPFQDKTQWTGSVPNGLMVRAMGRNVGQVYGVFGRFRPTKSAIGRIDYNGAGNSVKFYNLHRIETLVRQLEAPRYPLPVDEALAKRGEALFVSAGCMSCHWPNPGSLPGTWATPVTREGTDPRTFSNAQRNTVSTGILEGVAVPQWLGRDPLARDATQVALLSNVVRNTLLQELVSPRLRNGMRAAILADLAYLADAPDVPARAEPEGFARQQLEGLYTTAAATSEAAYEARVLAGIWAAAPYLHNGSVPSLWALLQKPELRPTRFMIGSDEFDGKHVGLATDRSPRGYTFIVGSCAPPDNGNGNCGHLWGTDLSDEEKWALIEYMKLL